MTFKEARNYNLKGQRVELVTYTGDHFSGGQALPFLGIMIDERLFTDFSKNVQDFVIAHEYGHRRFPKIISLILFIILFATPFIELAGFVSSIIFLILSIFYSIFIFEFIAGLIMFLLALSINWGSELDADFYAIDLIGLDNTKLAFEEMKSKKTKKSKSENIFYRLTHPPNKLTLYLYKKFKER